MRQDTGCDDTMQSGSARRGVTLAIAAVLSFAMCMSWMPGVKAAGEDDAVNVYSARQEALILPLLERFRERTGTRFNLVTGKADGLLKRLQLEGSASPADVLVTTDAGPSTARSRRISGMRTDSGPAFPCGRASSSTHRPG